ncbi:MAG: type IV pili twitching motility protein PilT, partial [Candidatus Omnitrophota bacterium]|nr:type IV pili twitching motility protein PilT [Candidatus Omnitrophota bacterium]
MAVKDLLKQMIERKASDLFYRAGGTPRLRIDGKLVDADDKVLSVEQVEKAAEELTTPQQRDELKRSLDIDFALYLKEFSYRFRVSIFMQRNWPSIVIRSVKDTIQTFEELNLPAEVLKKL